MEMKLHLDQFFNQLLVFYNIGGPCRLRFRWNLLGLVVLASEMGVKTGWSNVAMEDIPHFSAHPTITISCMFGDVSHEILSIAVVIPL